MAERVIKISTDDFRFISLFESLTNAGVKDCITYPDKVVFIVNEGDMGLAIGKAGANVKKVEDALGKKIDLIEYSKDPIQFLKNLVYPVKIKNAYTAQKSTGAKIINLQVENPNDKKALLANGKKRLNEAKGYFLRHHKIDDVDVA
ncbi:MAG: NusA-like transcription termination signal-binding factor [archaeon]